MPSNLLPFDSARLKLERAKVHIAVFRNSEAQFLAKKPFLVQVEHPAELGDFPFDAWFVREVLEAPKEFPVLIGDAIHNMRVALDLMASDLVRLNGKRSDNVYFPFAESEEKLDERIKNQNFNRAHPDVVTALKTLKPYKGGDPMLRALHDLDITDKHKALLPSVSAGQTRSVELLTADGPIGVPQWQNVIRKHGSLMAIVPKSTNYPLGSEIPANFALVFEADAPFSGIQISLLLHMLLDTTSRVVEKFALLCKGQASPASPSDDEPHGGPVMVVPGALIAEMFAYRAKVLSSPS